MWFRETYINDIFSRIPLCIYCSSNVYHVNQGYAGPSFIQIIFIFVTIYIYILRFFLQTSVVNASISSSYWVPKYHKNQDIVNHTHWKPKEITPSSKLFVKNRKRVLSDWPGEWTGMRGLFPFHTPGTLYWSRTAEGAVLPSEQCQKPQI